ncbi:MAG: SUMF1/EgtB/PvdO family nonheme iron enzyme [Candidatus Poribacteria bacterium]|nr:SUMF1/EgtB/PvdO family nonheme iron enzyme [Candidatus Poribacteria bacterium]
MKTFCIITCLLILALSQQIVYAQQALEQQAFTIFEQHCLDCHGEFGSYSDVLTIKHKDLIEDRSVIPGQPDASELYLRLLGDTDTGSQMPLGQDPLDAEEIATIRRWIEAGAPDWETIPKPKRRFITTEAMLKSIHTHVTSLTAFDRSFARYFTLTHLYNAGASDDNLRAYRNALSKLVNSLSWGAEVIKPTPIDQEETIFYIDLRHYEWDIKSDRWYKIEQAYPYGVQLKSSTWTTLCQETNCELPFVRADWFIATASLPPLYHEILDLPKTDKELETRLEVDVSENIKNAPGVRVWRAGFNDSGVSVNNRIVERHKSRYGAYWKSYDFAGNVGTQNIFTHPLNFTHDGGEIIFNLPNGLQAYYLSTATGDRLDEAPINIVSNAGARDPVVRNGLSCMGCHTEGMKTFEDQVRPVIEQNLNPSYDKAQALRLYTEKSEMDSLIREDIARYRQAIEAAGGVFGGNEPIQQLVKQFEGPLDAMHAAAEVGLETDDFLQNIRENSTLQNAGLLVLGVEKGTVKRDAWESEFGKVASALKPLKPDTADVYYNRGRANYRQERYKSAISDFDAALRINPDFAEAYYGRGAAKANIGQYEAAISDYNAALRLNPNFAGVYYDRGSTQFLLGQYGSAISDYNEAIRIDPDYVEAYNDRGFAKYKLGQYEAATRDFDTAIQIKANFALSYNNRGLANFALESYEAAIRDFDTAIRINPEFAMAYSNRGIVKHSLGQYDDAISDYGTALRIEPNMAQAYYGLGVAKDELGQTLEAKQDLRTALKLAEKAGDQNFKGTVEQYLQELEEEKNSSQLDPSNVDMVLIPAGEFQMGSNDNDAEDDENPMHIVYVDAFYIDKYEVTNTQYKKFIDANPQWQKDRIPRKYHDGDYLKHWNGNNYPPGKGNHPIVYVSWYAAIAYAQWHGKRLPIEAEWEKAARGGLVDKKYTWGDSLDTNKANYGESIGGTTAIGAYPANGYDLYDMTGNVWEWCLDEYNADFYSVAPRHNPIAGGTVDNIVSDFTNVKSVRVLRGGSWVSNAKFVRVSDRTRYTPKITNKARGFRCVRSITQTR